MNKASINIYKDLVISDIDNRIYGSFIEHLGRAVYGGIYEPTHPTADEEGFRGDVLDMVKSLNVPLVRYPGGNFVSGYNWEDGTGPKDKRPVRPELAWHVLETNEVGIDEFQSWARKANSDILMAVNLGTRGPEEARQLLEYCNFPAGTYYSEMRRKNGFDKPFNIKTWCLGNEMDGPWQICNKTKEEYARIAVTTAKIMKELDPSIELVACGSAHMNMPTFGEWELAVLKEAYEHIDYISLHNYYGNPTNDSKDYLASSIDMDSFIHTVISICDTVKGIKRTDKTINLSFDEWNVWFHSNDDDAKLEWWQKAPHQLEDIYNLEDALVVGSLLISLLKHSDRVKIACLAQLVNVIAPIMTVEGGPCYAQTIFYPFYYTSNYGRGKALTPIINCDTYSTDKHKNIPYVEAIAIDNEERGEIVVFAVNRSLEESIDFDINLNSYEANLIEHVVLTGDNLKAINTADKPDTVVPDKTSDMSLPKNSWNMYRFRKV